jgi:hypothetical protein
MLVVAANRLLRGVSSEESALHIPKKAPQAPELQWFLAWTKVSRLQRKILLVIG